MNRYLLFTIVAVGLLLLALAGWAVQGLRWTFSGRRRRRGRLVPA